MGRAILLVIFLPSIASNFYYIPISLFNAGEFMYLIMFILGLVIGVIGFFKNIKIYKEFEEKKRSYKNYCIKLSHEYKKRIDEFIPKYPDQADDELNRVNKYPNNEYLEFYKIEGNNPDYAPTSLLSFFILLSIPGLSIPENYFWETDYSFETYIFLLNWSFIIFSLCFSIFIFLYNNNFSKALENVKFYHFHMKTEELFHKKKKYFRDKIEEEKRKIRERDLIIQKKNRREKKKTITKR